MLKVILILLVIALVCFLYTVYLWHKTNEKLTFMLDSLDNDDVNFRFRERLFFTEYHKKLGNACFSAASAESL